MKKFTFSLLFIAYAIMGFAQQNMTLTFTGVETESGNWLQMDSINVRNMIKNCDTTLIYPDTVLMFESYAIDELNGNDPDFELTQNYPNPFGDKTIFGLKINNQSVVSIEVFDVIGQRVAYFNDRLQRGVHSFTFEGNTQRFYILNVTDGYHFQSLKLLISGSGNISGHRIIHNGQQALLLKHKASGKRGGFEFEPGDSIQIVGYVKGYQQSVLLETPIASSDYSLEFEAYETFTCGDPFTDERDGQVYQTVEIGNQCWMAENMNYEGGISWCYENDTNNCNTYGRLYVWISTFTACPRGWHVPNETEWKALEGTVDSQYPLGDPIWNDDGWRGFDAGKNLKSTSGWNVNGNGADLYGFNALPGGYLSGGSFQAIGYRGHWWSWSEISGEAAWSRQLRFGHDGSHRQGGYKLNGLSVRCLKY